MASRTLVLHGGFAKTGTSALQVGFARNREWLAGQGIDYLRLGHYDVACDGAIGSGNAVDLAYHLSGLEHRPAAVVDVLEALAATPSPHVLLSSEFLQSATADYLRDFVAGARALGFDVRAVFLVRAYYDWLWSAYVQNVKNHALTASFADWVPGAGLAHMFADTLRLYDAVLGAGNVRVGNYDGLRGNLLPAFLGLAFGLDARGAALELPGAINRSLTAGEIALLRRFNALRGSETEGTLLSTLLIAASPDEPAARGVDAAVLRWLATEVEADLAAINARIHGGALRLSWTLADCAGPLPALPQGGPVEALLLQTFALLLETRRELDQLRGERAQAAPPAPAAPEPEVG